MEYDFDSFKNGVEISEELYKKIYNLVRDFDNSTDDITDSEYLSDGEWLDIFFDVCLEIVFTPMIKEMTRWGYNVTSRDRTRMM